MSPFQGLHKIFEGFLAEPSTRRGQGIAAHCQDFFQSTKSIHFSHQHSFGKQSGIMPFERVESRGTCHVMVIEWASFSRGQYAAC